MSQRDWVQGWRGSCGRSRGRCRRGRAAQRRMAAAGDSRRGSRIRAPPSAATPCVGGGDCPPHTRPTQRSWARGSEPWRGRRAQSGCCESRSSLLWAGGRSRMSRAGRVIRYQDRYGRWVGHSRAKTHWAGLDTQSGSVYDFRRTAGQAMKGIHAHCSHQQGTY